MLKRLRQNMKTILWITIISFVALIFLGWGMDIMSGRGPSPNTVAKVNNYQVTRGELEMAVKNAYDQYRQQFNKEPSDVERDQLEEQAWNNIVQKVILTQEAEKRDLRASDKEVIYSIRMDPPPFIRSLETFQTNGQFDPEKYRQSLLDPLLDWTALEYWARSSIPIQKLQDLVMWGARVTQPELREVYDFLKETRSISFIFVDASAMEVDEAVVTEEDLKKYYNENKKRFTEPEKAKLAFVFLELKPSPSDSAEVLADMHKILGDIRGGEDFAEMARIHSEDPTADSGGSPGRYFRRGELTKPMEEALFALEVGEISEPFLDAAGYHIAKLEDRRTTDGQEEVSFRHILRTVRPGQTTIDLFRQTSTRMETAVADGLSLSEAAANEGLEVKETQPFTRNSFVPELIMLPKARELAFTLPVGSVKGPLTTYRGHYYIQVVERTKERVKPFEEVKDKCREYVLADLRAERAFEKAQEILSRAQADGLEAAAQADSLEVRTAGPFSRGGYVPGIGRDPALIGACFARTPESPPFAVKGLRGSFVVKVEGAEAADPQKFEAEKYSLAARLLDQKRGRAYTTWMKRLEERADIKDYREGY